MNTNIFGENHVSSRLTQLLLKGLHVVQETSPAEIGATLADFVRGLR